MDIKLDGCVRKHLNSKSLRKLERNNFFYKVKLQVLQTSSKRMCLKKFTKEMYPFVSSFCDTINSTIVSISIDIQEIRQINSIDIELNCGLDASTHSK